MRFRLIFFALLLPLCVSAQVNEGTDMPSMLFRGRHSTRYLSGFNGTPYWDTLSFRKGTVYYNACLYEDVEVRVDACEDQLNVRQDKSYASITPDPRQVAWFTRDSELFVNMEYLGLASPARFMLLVCDCDTPVFKLVQKKFRSVPGNHNGDTYIGYTDPAYNEKLISFYEITTSFWMLEKGNLVRLRARKARKIIASSRANGAFSRAIPAWHPVEGTGAELVAPSVKRSGVKVKESLPLGYFEAQADAGTLTETIDAKYKNKVYRIGIVGTATSAKIDGLISDDESVPLPGVLIVDSGSGTYTRSDKNGRYHITIPVGETVLTFSDPDKEEQKLSIILCGDGILNVQLHDRSTLLDAASISAESMRQHRTSDIGIASINSRLIAKIPTAFGEGDVLKVILALPGVQTVGEASAGFNVRGGSTDQNLILFNGNTIYYPTHFFGINSVFSPDMTDGVELHKGGGPASVGGRVSSVLDVGVREGSAKGFRGSLGLGVLTSRLNLEGPLGHKTTINTGFRTSYSDWLLGLVPTSSEFSGGSANFYDGTIVLTRRPDKNNTLQAFAYLSSDSFSFGADTTFRYGNANASLHWTKESGSWTAKTSIGLDHYSSEMEEEQNATEAYTLETSVDQVFARLNLKHPLSASHTMNAGAELLYYMLEGGHRLPLGEESMVIPHSLPRETALQPSLYFSDSWTPDPSYSVDAGLRLSSFAQGGTFYAYPELRLSGRYSFTPVLSVKAGLNSTAQYIHLISNSSSISPVNTWKLSDEKIRPTIGYQASTGVYWTVFGGKLDLSAETYYKAVKDHLDYAYSAILVMNENLADDLVRVAGRAYGVELMARKSVGQLNGWVSYTWSRSFLRDTQNTGLMAINGGRWYNSPNDKPHDFKFIGNYAFTKRYSLSLNIDYSTGRPVTFPVGYYIYANGARLAYSLRNAYRIPDYFRMDVAFNIDPGHYLKALAHASFTIGCYNVTGRKNAYSVFYDTMDGKSLRAYKLSIFATPVPYINLNIIF